MTLPFDLMPLHLLREGQHARIGQLMGDAEQVHRLEELGLRRGARVEVVCSGSPCIVRVEGTRLCFRTGELLGVLVACEEAA